MRSDPTVPFRIGRSQANGRTGHADRSDWNMEPMTGYELLEEVRADPKTPFIMVTAESKTENVIAAKKASVNNYIVKPFNAHTLQSKIPAVFPS